MFSCENIQQKIETYIKGSKAIVTDPRKDNEHFMVTVICTDFENMSLIEQHRLIYKALDEEIKKGLHSLSIKTKWKET